MVLVSPIPTKDGKAITGKVAYELIVDEPADQPQFVGRLGTAYPFASDGAPDAALTERDRPDGSGAWSRALGGCLCRGLAGAPAGGGCGGSWLSAPSCIATVSATTPQRRVASDLPLLAVLPRAAQWH